MSVDADVPRYTVAIDEPKVEMVWCAASGCGRELPKHEAYRVTVERWEPMAPDSGHQVTWQVGGDSSSTWRQSVRTWSAAQQAMLTAAAPRMLGPVYYPAATHAITTYTGYACCEEHAGAASRECPV